MLSAATDAEPGQRGFIITGDARYLAPYTNAATAADQALMKLRTLTARDPARQGCADLLQPVVSAKLLELKETVRLCQDGLEAAQGRVLTGTGLRLMAQIRETMIPASRRDIHMGHRGKYMAAPRTLPMGQGLDLAGLQKDGTEFPVEVSLSYADTLDGMRAIAFVTDISDRVALQRAARQADKLAALGTLSAGVAHEISNPIGIFTSRVELMIFEAEGGELPGETRKDLEVILRHARRVAAITKNL